MRADSDAVIQEFGKNEQVKKVFWTLFFAMAGLVMARVGQLSRWGLLRGWVCEEEDLHLFFL
jgi:hypothetical protein